MAEHVIPENGVRDLWCIQEIHFQQTGLLSTLIGTIILQSIEEERCSLLNHILAKEYVHHLPISQVTLG